MATHPGAVYKTEVVEDDFDSYTDMTTEAEDSESAVDDDLYVAIGEEEYRVDKRRVNDLEISSLTEVIQNLVRLTQTGGSIEEVDKLQWQATLLVCRMCPDIDDNIASCSVVHYESREDKALTGVSYRGKLLYMTIEEMVILLGIALKAYHTNRPIRIREFMSYKNDSIADDDFKKLETVMQADKVRAKELSTDFTQDIVNMYKYYHGLLDTEEKSQKPLPETKTKKQATPKPVTDKGFSRNRRTRRRAT